MRFILSILVGVILVAAATAQQVEEKPGREWPSAFAIITDRKTHAAAGKALRDYKEAIEADGLGAWLIADDFETPEAVRGLIRRLLTADPPLEGAVFVGRIPVPMIRDAQHLTAAFKMDQDRFPWRRSSVPSDRFYEDLDLEFEFLKRDEKEPALFYYSLAAGSPQRVEKEIYSARILPGETATPERLRTVLEKIVRRKRERRPLLEATVVTGHGYNSGSSNAWAEQGWMLREQMPWLFRPGGRARSFFHADHRNLKDLVFRAIQSPGLNLLVFHAHGRPTTQYLLGLPPATTIPAQTEAIQRALRKRLRQAEKRGKDVTAAQDALAVQYGVPASWFAGAFDDAVIRKDKEAEDVLDIQAADLTGKASAPEVVVFDECFNGRFIEPVFVAGAYVFGPGGTVAAVGNSVNVLQDVWADEFLGLVGLGMRLGRYHRLKPQLESHLIGDPTFRFAPRPGLAPAELLGDDDVTWKRLGRLLHDESAPVSLRALAIARLHRKRGPAVEPDIRKLCLNDPSDVVRLAALKRLAAGRVEGFAEILLSTARDPAEMVRRQTVRLMGDLGDPGFIEPLLRAAAGDPSRRVVFQAQSALNRFEPAAIVRALNSDLPDLEAAAREELRKRFGRRSRHLESDLALVKDRTADTGKRVRAVRTFRLYRLDAAVTPLLETAGAEQEDEKVRVATLETLGWFGLSRHRPAILEAVGAIERDRTTPDRVRAEARKTRRRLLEGPNDPFTP